MKRLVVSALGSVALLLLFCVVVLAAPVSLGAPTTVMYLDPGWPDTSTAGYDLAASGLLEGMGFNFGYILPTYEAFGSLTETVFVETDFSCTCVTTCTQDVGFYVVFPGQSPFPSPDLVSWSGSTVSFSKVYSYPVEASGDLSFQTVVELSGSDSANCFLQMTYPYYDEPPEPTPVPPDRVSWLWATDNVSGTGSLTLNWDDVGADSYDVYRDGQKIVSDTVSTSVPDSGLVGGEAYVYHVISKDSGGGSTPGVSLVIEQGEGDTLLVMPSLSMASSTQSLYQLGLLPVITLAATVFIASLLYVRFRR